MGFPYPRASNWILSRRTPDGTYTLKDCLCGGEYTLGSTIGYLWKRLDGKTDPQKILPGCSQREVASMIAALDKEEMIRHSRVLDRSAGSITYSLIIPRHHIRRGVLPVIINSILLVSWCPVLLLGIYSFIENWHLFDTSYMLLGQLFGLLLGCICHEAGHACAGLACGARFLEAGVLLQHGFPGAYVLLGDSNVKRMHKVQIHAAGVEANFLIAGSALIIASLFPSLFGFFFGVAFNNLFLGLINLMLIDSLDGIHIIETLLGYHPLDIIKDKEMRDSLKKEGAPGILELIICYILRVLQLVYPALLILNGLEVVLWLIFIGLS